MLLHAFLIILSLIVLCVGAEFLVRSSVSIATRLGMSAKMAGLTIVAVGTSTPELAVSLMATFNSDYGIALGNVVGSNIFNIAVILGVTVLITPIVVNIKTLTLDAMLMLVASIVLFILIKTGGVSRLFGLCFISVFILYNVYIIYSAKKDFQPLSDENAERLGIEKPLHKHAIWVVLAIVIMIAGTQLLMYSATALAQSLGLEQAIIGLTIVAAGTSMPELVTSVVAAIRKQPEVALGNIIGSNIFNILGILGICALVSPVVQIGVSNIDLVSMVFFSVLLIPLLYTQLTLNRIEGFILLASYGLYLYWLWPA